jgi:hypothetical protein
MKIVDKFTTLCYYNYIKKGGDAMDEYKEGLLKVILALLQITLTIVTLIEKLITKKPKEYRRKRKRRKR